jgi:hypothetical protein
MERRYPAGVWRSPAGPAGAERSERPGVPRVLVLHSMAGLLAGVDAAPAAKGRCARYHFGVGGPWDGASLDGAVWQWQQLTPGRPTSVDTSDGGDPLRPWSSRQLAALVDLGAWWCRQTGHPSRLVRSATEPGIGYHAQFGEWNPDGRICPGPTRIAQLHDVVIPRIATALTQEVPVSSVAPFSSPTTPGADMPLTQDDLNRIAATVWGATFGGSPTTGAMLQRAQVDVNAIARAVVAALPQVPPGGLTEADVETAVKNVLKRGVLA